MRILILGGTVFLGRHLAQAALARGHELTLFNRGQHNPELFPETEKLRGDRDSGLEALHGRQWDAVVDTCGYVPRVVNQSAALLADAADCYVFISSISVYADASTPGLNEDSQLFEPEMETEEVTGESYGPLKVACERTVEAAFPGRSLIIRPGLIVGPHDPTDRFTYYPVRLHRGGQMVAPVPEDAPVQVIDVRDLADWTIRLIEDGCRGAYNATGPAQPMTMAEMLTLSRAAIGSDAELCWMPAQDLLDAGVEPWIDLPLWLPMDDMAGLLAVDVSKAIAEGLNFRPIGETARDTLAWASGRPASHEWRAGLSAEREQELLARWHD